MKLVQSNMRWLIALVVGVCLVGAAVGMAQLDRGPSPSAVPTARDVHQLSSVFRDVSKQVLPSVVAIDTVGKPAQMTRQFGSPFNEDSPFYEFFKNDPQFREFFQQTPQRQMPLPRGRGSGFIIDKNGTIMTNGHVVQDAEEVQVRLQDDREFPATVVGIDPRSDVAVIRIKGATGLKPIKLGNSDATEIGDWVLAVGSPFGLDMSVTAGIISAKGRGVNITERADFLQTDAAINPGNSGGPLVNLSGEVIGINTAISTRSGAYDGVGFAIPINMAKWVADQLIQHGEVKRAYLGVSIQQVTSDLAKQFGVKVGQGAIVTQVFPDSPAGKANLESGDVILDLNGHKVTGPRDLQGIVEKLAIDKQYQMTVLRNGKRLQVPITLKEMPEEYSLANLTNPQHGKSSPSEASFADLGIEIQELTSDLAEQFGYAKDVHGVLISSVKSGSPADLAGLRSGLIIEKVGSEPVTSPEEFRKAMKNVSLKDGVLLFVRSPRGTQFLVIKAK